MLQAAKIAGAAIIGLFRRHPWIGWLSWAIFIAGALARVHPRRFASTFSAYLDAAQRLWAGQQVYDPTTLGDFLYFPITLLVYVPFTWLDRVAAASLALLISAVFFTWAVTRLSLALAATEWRSGEAIALTGIPLLVNIPAAWFNFKGIQAQVPMTAAMIAAVAAMAACRWRGAAFWLFVALAMKPLAIVMILLCGALVREMRWLLVVAVAAVVLLPFAFLDWSYLSEQYRAMGLKLWHIATASPESWPYQADFSTMLRALGLQLTAAAALAIRLAAAFATLALAWRIKQEGSPRSLAIAMLVLSGCYITLFGPRNEFLSFIVLTPALAVLAGNMLARNDARGWLLMIAVLVLGFDFNLQTDAVLKPAIVLVLYVWLAWVMAIPTRWHEIVEGNMATRLRTGERATTAAFADRR
jgi:Glycosyltransferase family 87